MSRPLDVDAISRRVAADIADGAYVNLGIGLPMRVADWLPDSREVMIHSENGVLGMGPTPPAGSEDWDLINAGKQPVTLRPGGAFFHQADSFAMVRGGHLDLTILGAYQVAANGDLANWALPGAKAPAVGGAMDLAVGARAVWVMLAQHAAKDGTPRLLERCTLPLTGVACVNRVYSDLAVIDITPQGFLVTDLVAGCTREALKAITAAPLRFARELRVLEGPA